jgi:hypothetical protein
MRGAILPIPQYVFMARCLVKYRDNFIFTFTKRKLKTKIKKCTYVRGPFAKFVDWQQCAAVI